MKKRIRKKEKEKKKGKSPGVSYATISGHLLQPYVRKGGNTQVC